MIIGKSCLYKGPTHPLDPWTDHGKRLLTRNNRRSLTQPDTSLLEPLAHLEDPRLERTKCPPVARYRRYCHLASGADSWVHETYGKAAKQSWLEQFDPCPMAFPAHDTFARSARLDPEAFRRVFPTG